MHLCALEVSRKFILRLCRARMKENDRQASQTESVGTLGASCPPSRSHDQKIPLAAILAAGRDDHIGWQTTPEVWIPYKPEYRSNLFLKMDLKKSTFVL